MTDADTCESAMQQLLESVGECAFCEREGSQNSVFLYTLEDLNQTDLGEEPPVRHMRICGACYDRVLPNTTLVEQSEVPGLAE